MASIGITPRSHLGTQQSDDGLYSIFVMNPACPQHLVAHGWSSALAASVAAIAAFNESILTVGSGCSHVM